MARPPYNYRTYFSEERRGDIAIIWIGQNGNDSDTVFTQTDLLIDHLVSYDKKFVVLPKTSSTDELDAQYIEKYGKHVVNIRAYLCQPIYDEDGTTIISSYGLADAGILPTTQDLTDIANKIVPTSLRYDGTHYNAYGYEILATLVAKKLAELQYI
jgi:hypothetical protein